MKGEARDRVVDKAVMWYRVLCGRSSTLGGQQCCLPARAGPYLPAPPVRRACRMRPPPGTGWGPLNCPSCASAGGEGRGRQLASWYATASLGSSAQPGVTTPATLKPYPTRAPAQHSPPLSPPELALASASRICWALSQFSSRPAQVFRVVDCAGGDQAGRAGLAASAGHADQTWGRLSARLLGAGMPCCQRGGPRWPAAFQPLHGRQRRKWDAPQTALIANLLCPCTGHQRIKGSRELACRARP